MHCRGVIHRDLKPENVVIGKDGYIKLIDFGFSKMVGNEKTAKTHTTLGTPEYMCPECIQAVGHSKPVDLWCLGVLLFEMIAGHVPFYKEDPFETYQMILKLEYEFPSFLWMAVSAKDLISLFLVLNPHDRIDDFLAIKGHAFFFGVDWVGIEEKTVEVPSENLPEIKADDPGSNFLTVPEETEVFAEVDESVDRKVFKAFSANN